MTKRGKLIKYAQAKVPDARNVEHTATVSIFEHHPGYFTLYLDHIQPPLPEREGEMMGGTRELAEERFGHFAVGPITEGPSQDIRKQSREAMLAGSMLSALPFEKRAEYLKRMGQSQGNPGPTRRIDPFSDEGRQMWERETGDTVHNPGTRQRYFEWAKRMKESGGLSGGTRRDPYSVENKLRWERETGDSMNVPGGAQRFVEWTQKQSQGNPKDMIIDLLIQQTKTPMAISVGKAPITAVTISKLTGIPQELTNKILKLLVSDGVVGIEWNGYDHTYYFKQSPSGKEGNPGNPGPEEWAKRVWETSDDNTIIQIMTSDKKGVDYDYWRAETIKYLYLPSTRQKAPYYNLPVRFRGQLENQVTQRRRELGDEAYRQQRGYRESEYQLGY